MYNIMKYIIIILLLFGCSKSDISLSKEGYLLHEGNFKTWVQILYTKTEDKNIQPLQPIQDRWIFYHNNNFKIEQINNNGNWTLKKDGFWIVEDNLFRLILDDIFFDFKLLSLKQNNIVLESEVNKVIFNETWEEWQR